MAGTKRMRSCLAKGCKLPGSKKFYSDGPGNRVCPACTKRLARARVSDGAAFDVIHPVQGPGLKGLPLEDCFPARGNA